MRLLIVRSQRPKVGPLCRSWNGAIWVIINTLANWQGIILHHSASSDTPGADTASFRRFHVTTRGWLDIGYHAIVEKIGNLYQVLGGRPLNISGAHCPGKNSTHLGLCLAGDFSHEVPCDEQLLLAARTAAGWCGAFKIRPEEISLHRMHKETQCPGNIHLERFQGMVQALLLDPYPAALAEVWGLSPPKD